jgi:hypothetical protein
MSTLPEQRKWGSRSSQLEIVTQPAIWQKLFEMLPLAKPGGFLIISIYNKLDVSLYEQ